jgi:CO dehydrogenase/acetyl-CoA synthase gamma subunit (corrinoid Fe-S protein)
MIALTVSDVSEPNSAVLRISELSKRMRTYGAPDAICVRNDSFAEEPFTAMVELVKNLWTGPIVLESDNPAILSRALVPVMDRRPILIGATGDNIEAFSIASGIFHCPLCLRADDLEGLMDLSAKAQSLGVKEILLEPVMRNMKQCLEICTDIKRLSEVMPEAAHPVLVRTWSGEYAMTMAAVTLLVDDAIIVADDLDEDSCETLHALVSSIR